MRSYLQWVPWVKNPPFENRPFMKGMMKIHGLSEVLVCASVFFVKTFKNLHGLLWYCSSLWRRSMLLFEHRVSVSSQLSYQGGDGLSKCCYRVHLHLTCNVQACRSLLWQVVAQSALKPNTLSNLMTFSTGTHIWTKRSSNILQILSNFHSETTPENGWKMVGSVQNPTKISSETPPRRTGTLLSPCLEHSLKRWSQNHSSANSPRPYRWVCGLPEREHQQ